MVSKAFLLWGVLGALCVIADGVLDRAPDSARQQLVRTCKSVGGALVETPYSTTCEVHNDDQ